MSEKKKNNTTQVAINIPNPLKEKIVESAIRNCRSIGSEIVYRLLSSFPDHERLSRDLMELFNKLHERKKRKKICTET